MQIAQALDAERRRISAELHDRTGPNLAAITVNLSTLENRLNGQADESVAELLAQTRALLTETIAEIRDLSADLRPARLEYSGLVPALADRIAQFRQRTGLDVQWNVRLRQEGGLPERLPGEQELLVYRVVQETLTNCAKHAAARAVILSLTHVDDILELHICDDGVGFDPATLAHRPNAPGMGLLMIRERVEEAGGTFYLFSQPGQGTQIRITVPLAGAASP
jgi:two-component system sensor histidine kinase UhpB